MTTDDFFKGFDKQQRELDRLGLEKSEQTKKELNDLWDEK